MIDLRPDVSLRPLNSIFLIEIVESRALDINQ